MDMIKFILGLGISIILFNTNVIFAQAPGGVKNPVVWKTSWEQKSQTEFGEEKFNYHPYQYFDEDRGYHESVLGNLKRVSLFMVFSSTNTSDIGELTLNNSKVLLTDSKVISRRDIAYEKHEDLPTLLTYVEAFPNSNSLPNEVPSFLIGSKGVNETWYEGGVAEIVLYDRLISKEQRRKVETYLSLKYGISLADSLDYFASNDEKIWDYTNAGKFNNRLTGIGKDTEGGLDQKQSRNLYGDFPLTLAVNGLRKMNNSNSSELEDMSFLLWADDGGEIELKNTDPSNKDILNIKRKWKINTLGKGWKNKAIEVSVDPQNIIGYDTELSMWMVLNNNQDMQLENLNKNQLIPMLKNESGTYTAFVNFDMDESNFDYFTFIQAPENFITYEMSSVECDKNGGGVDIYLHGFNPDESNYFLRNDNSKQLEGKWYVEEQRLSFGHLPFGTYDIVPQNLNLESLYQFTFSKGDCEGDSGFYSSLYPNPVAQGEFFTIELPADREAKLYLEIHDVLGRKIKDMVISPDSNNSYSDKLLDEGAYTVTLRTGKNKVVRTLVVVNK